MSKQTPAQQLASTENWSIYILQGMARILHHVRPVVKARTYRLLSDTIALAVEEIKTTQRARSGTPRTARKGERK